LGLLLNQMVDGPPGLLTAALAGEIYQVDAGAVMDGQRVQVFSSCQRKPFWAQMALAVAGKSFGFPTQFTHDFQELVCKVDLVALVKIGDLYPGFIVPDHRAI
jgi:hypothetical protein